MGAALFLACSFVNVPFPAQRIADVERNINELNATSAILASAVADIAKAVQQLEVLTKSEPPPPPPPPPPPSTPPVAPPPVLATCTIQKIDAVIYPSSQGSGQYFALTRQCNLCLRGGSSSPYKIILSVKHDRGGVDQGDKDVAIWYANAHVYNFDGGSNHQYCYDADTSLECDLGRADGDANLGGTWLPGDTITLASPGSVGACPP